MKQLLVTTIAIFAFVGHAETAQKVATAASKPKAAKKVTKTTTKTETVKKVEAPAPAPVTAPAPVAAAPAASTETVVVPSESKILGSLELRPYYKSKVGETHTENEAMLGYQFNKNVNAVYRHYINTNIYNPADSTTGLNLTSGGGFAQVKVNNIWQSGVTAFNYEGRVYSPTAKGDRDAGFITLVRNYFKLKNDLNKTLTLTVAEVPMFYVTTKSGGPDGANRVFQNRVIAMASVNFTDKLSLDVPFLYDVFTTKEHAGKAGSTGHDLWFYPELNYAVAPHWDIGMAFEAHKLTGANFETVRIGDSFREASTQLFVRATL